MIIYILFVWWASQWQIKRLPNKSSCFRYYGIHQQIFEVADLNAYLKVNIKFTVTSECMQTFRTRMLLVSIAVINWKVNALKYPDYLSNVGIIVIFFS